MLDAHQHFWRPERGDYGWLTPETGVLYRDFLPADLRPLMQAAGITRSIVVQAAETEAETDFLLALAAETDFVAGVVGWLDMTAEDFPARLAYYRAQPKWVGLRPMLQEHPPEKTLDPRFRAALREVARQDVPFDILTFPRHLPAMLTVLAEVPDLCGIVDHISKPEMTKPTLGDWAGHMTALAAHPRLMCKISGMVTEAGADWSADRIRPFLRHAAKAFGPERLVFGTDWPVCTLAARHGEVMDLARTLLAELYDAADLEKIFETNGARFYRLGA
ncbi:MAG TPA: amidohydrolase family protein [Acidisoma sp.]|uniref:amidohydrolase family protein n=1 Tax=Acidisoma sp. TaxID=1872115 RepID=UPI002C542019|nr:amidohydrolase family protein [Acidisoma sp.]HTI02458.1 amidohydrolase family protein [Acidisoma sp.]